MSNAAATAEAPASADAPEQARSKKKLFILIGLSLLLVGGGTGGYLYWQSRTSAHAKEAAKPKPPAPLQFLALDPAFVVNFQGAQTVRFLQIEARLGSREIETIELMKANEPVIRNDLLMLFGGQDAAQLATRDGKEKLRAESLAQVRRIVKGAGGKPESVEAIFFTSFVMQ